MKFTATVSAEYSLLMFAFSYNVYNLHSSAATETMTNGRSRDPNPMRLKWYTVAAAAPPLYTAHVLICIYNNIIYVNKQYWIRIYSGK